MRETWGERWREMWQLEQIIIVGMNMNNFITIIFLSVCKDLSVTAGSSFSGPNDPLYPCFDWWHDHCKQPLLLLLNSVLLVKSISKVSILKVVWLMITMLVITSIRRVIDFAQRIKLNLCQTFLLRWVLRYVNRVAHNANRVVRYAICVTPETRCDW